jgi:hypothetical protein
MSGKTILFLVSNGLLEHKPRIGTAIWEFLWFIDKVTKDEPDGNGKFNGLVLGGQPVSAATIARDLREHVNTAKANIKALEAKGYITRRRLPDNRCSYAVTNSKKWLWTRRNSGGTTGIESCASTGNAGTENCAGPVLKAVPAHTQTCTSNKERHDSDTTVKQNKRPVAFDPSSLELPEWLPKHSWLEWCQHRKESKEPLTQLAAKKSISSLDCYRKKGYPPEVVIDHSIASNYQGLFPPKDRPRNSGNGSYREIETRAESAARLAKEKTRVM